MKRIGFIVIFILLILVCLLLFFPGKEIISRIYSVSGIDVSHYQEVIDWKSIAENDISFVFVKAKPVYVHTIFIYIYIYKYI